MFCVRAGCKVEGHGRGPCWVQRCQLLLRTLSPEPLGSDYLSPASPSAPGPVSEAFPKAETLWHLADVTFGILPESNPISAPALPLSCQHNLLPGFLQKLPNWSPCFYPGPFSLFSTPQPDGAFENDNQSTLLISSSSSHGAPSPDAKATYLAVAYKALLCNSQPRQPCNDPRTLNNMDTECHLWKRLSNWPGHSSSIRIILKLLDEPSGQPRLRTVALFDLLPVAPLTSSPTTAFLFAPF